MYVSIPSERANKELLNASFSFKIGHSKLKLWALKVSHTHTHTKKKHKQHYLHETSFYITDQSEVILKLLMVTETHRMQAKFPGNFPLWCTVVAAQ